MAAADDWAKLIMTQNNFADCCSIRYGSTTESTVDAAEEDNHQQQQHVQQDQQQQQQLLHLEKQPAGGGSPANLPPPPLPFLSPNDGSRLSTTPEERSPGSEPENGSAVLGPPFTMDLSIARQKQTHPHPPPHPPPPLYPASSPEKSPSSSPLSNTALLFDNLFDTLGSSRSSSTGSLFECPPRRDDATLLELLTLCSTPHPTDSSSSSSSPAASSALSLWLALGGGDPQQTTATPSSSCYRQQQQQQVQQNEETNGPWSTGTGFVSTAPARFPAAPTTNLHHGSRREQDHHQQGEPPLRASPPRLSPPLSPPLSSPLSPPPLRATPRAAAPLKRPPAAVARRNELRPPNEGPTYWGMWEDERSRMVYVSWLPRSGRAIDRQQKKRCELVLKDFIGHTLGFQGLSKVLLFPPTSAHCKLLFESEVAARRFLAVFGGFCHGAGPTLWKVFVCQQFGVDIREGIQSTRVKVIWADQTKNESETFLQPVEQKDQLIARQRAAAEIGVGQIACRLIGLLHQHQAAVAEVLPHLLQLAAAAAPM